MECSTAAGMVTRYINQTLSVDELERFLNHVETCPKCRDELETYFIVHEVVQQLDEDEGSVLDFRKLLEEDMRRARGFIKRQKIRRVLTAFGFFLLIGILVVFLAVVFMEVRHFMF